MALIWQIVCSLVDTPDRVKVGAALENNVTRYLVQVKENEIGQVIGKQGHTARALRTILAAIAMKEKRRIELDIATTTSSATHIGSNPTTAFARNASNSSEGEHNEPSESEDSCIPLHRQ
jgi:hypothetical protein